MSYILDALKKSEKERTLGNIPTLESGSSAEGRRVPLSWFIGLLAVLIAAVALLGTWSLWPGGKDAVTTVAPQAKETVLVEVPAPRTAPDAAQEASTVTARQGQAVGATGEAAVQTEVAQPIAVTLAELDPSIRARLPDLSVNVLSYSENSAKRFVMINQNIYKEGQNIGGGVVIEEITRSRVILNFEGISFVLLP